MKITSPGMSATDEQPFQGSGYWTGLPQGSSFLATLGYFNNAFGIGIERSKANNCSNAPMLQLQIDHRCQSVVFFRSIRYAEGIVT